MNRCNQACWPGLYSCRFSYFYYGTFPSCIFLYFQTPALSSIRVPALFVCTLLPSFVCPSNPPEHNVWISRTFLLPKMAVYSTWFSVCKWDAPRVVLSLPIGLKHILAVGLLVYKPALRRNRGGSHQSFQRANQPNSREGGSCGHSALPQQPLSFCLYQYGVELAYTSGALSPDQTYGYECSAAFFPDPRVSVTDTH